MASTARNAPCPCGSGKHYKNCHGALARTGSAMELPRRGLQQRLEAGLAAQQRGHFAAAAELYDAVLAEDPENFDALHMRGVTAYQSGDLECARDRVAAALRVRPVSDAARYNLRLIGSALERRPVEREICREVLPRLYGRCVVDCDSNPGQANQVDLIVSYRDMSARWQALRALSAWLGGALPTVWLYADSPRPDGRLDFRTLGPERFPQTGKGIFFGAERSPAEWYGTWKATDIALYCSDDAHCLLLDRIPELAREGETPIRMLYASSADAQRVGLPGLVVREER